MVFRLVFTCGFALDLLDAVRRDGRDEPAGAIFVKPFKLDGCVLPAFRDVGFRDVLLGDERGTETFAVGLTGREAVALGCLDVDDLVERRVFLVDFEDLAVDVGVFVFGGLDDDVGLLGVASLDDNAGVLGPPSFDLRERLMATLSRKRCRRPFLTWSKKPGDSVGGGAFGTG